MLEKDKIHQFRKISIPQIMEKNVKALLERKGFECFEFKMDECELHEDRESSQGNSQELNPKFSEYPILRKMFKTYRRGHRKISTTNKINS